MLVIYGPRIVTQSCGSHVGSGSSEHCFDGDSLTMTTTSSTVKCDTLEDTQAHGSIVDNEGWLTGMRCGHTGISNLFIDIIMIILCCEYWCRCRFFLTHERIDRLPHTTMVITNPRQLPFPITGRLGVRLFPRSFKADPHASRDATVLFALNKRSSRRIDSGCTRLGVKPRTMITLSNSECNNRIEVVQ